MQAGIGHIAGRRVLAVRAGRVVALLADLPADAVPDLVQVGSLALNTDLVSRQTWTSPLPTSISDAAGRVLPTKWLYFDRPCVRSTCITSLRSAVRTCSSTPSSSLNSALSVSSSRRALTWPAQFLASP
jgi:hypothetical protein